MKKLITVILTLCFILSMSVIMFADGTTTITTTVPAATYTLNIPADQEISFGQQRVNLGTVTVTNSQGFASGKNLKVKITYDVFSSDSVSTTIPYTLIRYEQGDYDSKILSGGSIIFLGNTNGTVDEKAKDMDALYMEILSTDWGKALAGDYSTIITFTSEVISSSN